MTAEQSMLFNLFYWHPEAMILLGKINSIALTWLARSPVVSSSYLSPNYNSPINCTCKEECLPKYVVTFYPDFIIAHLNWSQKSVSVTPSVGFSTSSRPVFTAQAPNSLQPSDPSLSWNGPLELFDLNTQGFITGIHEIFLNRGDFVEVDAEFNLVISRGRSKPPNLRVFLCCKQLLRLSIATVHSVRNPFLHPRL